MIIDIVIFVIFITLAMKHIIIMTDSLTYYG